MDGRTKHLGPHNGTGGPHGFYEVRVSDLEVKSSSPIGQVTLSDLHVTSALPTTSHHHQLQPNQLFVWLPCTFPSFQCCYHSLESHKLVHHKTSPQSITMK
ncbi:hypothetical protein PGT21_024664 [Puccinia graminis f. sp. tritici]|uniref:Uncharacterized protein n=1 Tax=Puccinia graminis f. sp. tritici TaxID=56615 RepID=A0A5B0P8Q0_PUCGR|nr:hypothetical protein PGT21_024664 [Puccinia graminis f. sp. tritici]